ncbi:MAG: BamA/TamA family outer membrane protein, partial [Bacteroidales bacterium]|nr:BamA/TamA family outer membrane protein [Bacteroidales bacterium]
DCGPRPTQRPNAASPGGEFKFSEFYKQFAFGTGVGLRYDFKFFLIRVDMGIPLRDPSLLSTGENTWVIRRLRWRNLLFNFGIGYPF